MRPAHCDKKIKRCLAEDASGDNPCVAHLYVRWAISRTLIVILYPKLAWHLTFDPLIP